jgi:hypothetical protein
MLAGTPAERKPQKQSISLVFMAFYRQELATCGQQRLGSCPRGGCGFLCGFAPLRETKIVGVHLAGGSRSNHRVLSSCLPAGKTSTIFQLFSFFRLQKFDINLYVFATILDDLILSWLKSQTDSVHGRDRCSCWAGLSPSFKVGSFMKVLRAERAKGGGRDEVAEMGDLGGCGCPRG